MRLAIKAVPNIFKVRHKKSGKEYHVIEQDVDEKGEIMWFHCTRLAGGFGGVIVHNHYSPSEVEIIKE